MFVGFWAISNILDVWWKFKVFWQKFGPKTVKVDFFLISEILGNFKGFSMVRKAILFLFQKSCPKNSVELGSIWGVEGVKVFWMEIYQKKSRKLFFPV